MKKELVPLVTLNLTCGTVVVHQLYGIDMRSILSMYGGKASQVRSCCFTLHYCKWQTINHGYVG